MKLNKNFVVINIILLMCLILIPPLINIMLYPIYFVILVVINEKMKGLVSIRFRYLWMTIFIFVSIFLITLDKDAYMVYINQYYYLFVGSICILFLSLPSINWSKILSNSKINKGMFPIHKLWVVVVIYLLIVAYVTYIYFG